MFILKFAGKILLLPVWLILFVIGLAVKMTVQTYLKREEEITSKQVEIDVRAEMNVFRKKFGKLYELECSETEEKFSDQLVIVNT